MGGACPSRAPPTPSVEGSRAPPPPLVGGWYRDGKNWVHVKVIVVITDGVDGGLRGSGTMPAADVMVVHFDHLRHRHVQGHIQSNGDIKWANGKAWLKYEGEWQDHGGSASGSAPHLSISPGSASESMSPEPVSESLIVAAPTELAPQEPQANLAAWGDDVVDTPHARACEALKEVQIEHGKLTAIPGKSDEWCLICKHSWWCHGEMIRIQARDGDEAKRQLEEKGWRLSMPGKTTKCRWVCIPTKLC